MNWTNFVTYGDGYDQAFETLCTQLFERYLKRNYKDELVKFRVINGAGGDGGIEAYGELRSGDILALQAKWFPDVLTEANEIKQMRNSVVTAKTLRKQIKEYYFCVPRKINSLKFGRGAAGEEKKPIKKYEEKTIEKFTNEIETKFPDLTIRWWFNQDLDFQIMEKDNEGVQKFWFEKEILSFKYLIEQFDLQKSAWLFNRYTPELHSQGFIQEEIRRLLYDEEFRNTLQARLKKDIKPLETAVQLIDKFIGSLHPVDSLRITLEVVQPYLVSNLSSLEKFRKRIARGEKINDNPPLESIPISASLIEDIQNHKPSNVQKGIKQRLVDTLTMVKSLDLEQLVREFAREAGQHSRLFLGAAGSGKTHALANTVDTHLNTANSPAIIIKAKSSPSDNWSHILTNVLELDGWDKNQVLSALETLAFRNDRIKAGKSKPGEEPKKGPTRVVICIDGLEEDPHHWLDWYERMRESAMLIQFFPRLRFVFSARNYFLIKEELPDSEGFAIREVPQEGDIPIHRAMETYFRPEHYNIDVRPKSLIRGIDSLFALRLFCEMYQGQVITEESEITTIERSLLKKKVEQIDAEFKSTLGAGISHARRPVKEALEIITDIFYDQDDVEHRKLFEKLESELGQYLSKSQIDGLIDYLTDRGFLIREEKPIAVAHSRVTKIVYTLVNQSIMELIKADRFASAIMRGETDRLPAELLTATTSLHEKNK